MKHPCHALGCSVEVPSKMFACKRHWYMVPKSLRDRLWREYRPGQENDKKPSCRYIAVQRRCVYEIAQREGRTAHSEPYLNLSQRMRAFCLVREGGDPLEGFDPPVDPLLVNHLKIAITASSTRIVEEIVDS